jgi:SAM-dependent methyltransferase
MSLIKPDSGIDRMAEMAELRCPCDRKSRLATRQSDRACTGCDRVFPVIDGTVVLINDEASVFNISDYVAGSADSGGVFYGEARAEESFARKVYHKFTHWLVNSDTNAVFLRPRHAIARLCARKNPADPRYKILVIGSGNKKYAERPECEFVYTDVVFGASAQYICDAHDLPFADGSFDMIIAVAVLEHVMDPQRCVSEFHRVLKSDGWIYASTPFLQPVHMSAYDFTRFTLLGHRRLFRFFDEIESGATHGPGSVLAWCIQHFLLSFSDNRTLRKILRLIGKLLTRPLKLLDRRLTRNLGALDAAGGVFFAGQRRLTPIRDRDIIKMYRGIE